MLDINYDYPRDTTREQYKEINRMLRTTRRAFEKKMAEFQGDIQSYMTDCAIYGTGIMSVDTEGFHHVPFRKFYSGVKRLCEGEKL